MPKIAKYYSILEFKYNRKIDFKEGVCMGNNISSSKQAKMQRQRDLMNKILMIPVFILLAIVPLIVRKQDIYPEMAAADALNESVVQDLFSNYKATAIIVLCVAMVILTFLMYQKDLLKKDKYILIYAIGAGVFLGVSFLATLFSDYSETSWWGIPGRSEGFVITACYIILMFYMMYSFWKYDNYKVIVVALSVLVVMTTIIGAFQYAGKDLFVNSNFVKRLIMSKEEFSLLKNVENTVGDRTIYGTMYHYNYVGSLGAMMVPLFASLAFFVQGKKKKLFCGMITLCAMFVLFGSTSRAGFIGLILALIVGSILFGKKIIKKWKVTLPVMLGIVVIIVGFNYGTGGTIFRRIPTLVNDTIGLLAGSDESFDYKEHIPVKDVTTENGSTYITLQTGTLVISQENGDFIFTDHQGQSVTYTLNDTVYTTLDERFNNVSFEIMPVQSTAGAEVPNIVMMSVNGQEAFLFKADTMEGVTMSDSYPVQTIQIDYPDTVGFKGKEKLGSARGYIWSRSIPMMKDTFLIGYGPDTYVIKFPQNDFLGKWWAYDTPRMTVDKVHSMYLQYFINNGGLALIGFLVLVITYIVQCFKLYAFRGIYEDKEIIGIATFLAVIGYLGAAIFNDSVVSIAPIFWILLGTGIAINFMINKESDANRKRLAHATIDMKTRKQTA